MLRRFIFLAVAAMGTMSLWSLSRGSVTAQQRESSGSIVAFEAAPEPQSGFFTWVGGPAKRKIARTQTSPATFPETAGFVNLPNGVVTQVVAAGDTDLFNVAFSAECQVHRGGADDKVFIRVVDIVGGAIIAVLEPSDGL